MLLQWFKDFAVQKVFDELEKKRRVEKDLFILSGCLTIVFMVWGCADFELEYIKKNNMLGESSVLHLLETTNWKFLQCSTKIS